MWWQDSTRGQGNNFPLHVVVHDGFIRFLLSLADCTHSIVLDDHFNVLPISSHIRTLIPVPPKVILTTMQHLGVYPGNRFLDGRGGWGRVADFEREPQGHTANGTVGELLPDS